MVITAMSFEWSQTNMISLIIPTDKSIKAKDLVKIGRTRSGIIGRICPFLQFLEHNFVQYEQKFSQIYCTEPHQICIRYSYI